MKIVNSIKELKSYLAEEKRNNKQIGFVPTWEHCMTDT